MTAIASHQQEVFVTNDLGLHLRAAGVLVQVASSFACDITLIKGDMQANAKSIMAVLSLGAHKGSTLTVVTRGEDAQEALNAVCNTIREGFHGR